MTKSHALEDKYKEEAKEAKEETQETSLDKLPSPTGWSILVSYTSWLCVKDG